MVNTKMSSRVTVVWPIYINDCDKPRDFLFREGLKVGGVFRIGLPARRTETILVRTDSMPAKSTNLVATCAWKKIQVVDFQWFHT